MQNTDALGYATRRIDGKLVAQRFKVTISLNGTPVRPRLEDAVTKELGHGWTVKDWWIPEPTAEVKPGILSLDATDPDCLA